MRPRSVYEMNYERLKELLGEAPEKIEPQSVYRLCSGGHPDLVVEKLSSSPTEGPTLISLAHYVERRGDLCQSPEMVLRIFPPGEGGFEHLALSTDLKLGRVEALLFQSTMPPRFRAVYPVPGRFSPRLKRELNAYLVLWLWRLKDRGYQVMDEPSESARPE